MAANYSKSAWYPIAAEHELHYRHVYHAGLLGHEFAVWRADDDTINVWENRCLHRGVKLSIGVNMGAELKCQYHGWRYANGTAACTYIPAHPANAPARTIKNRTYPVTRRFGLVWTSLDPEGKLPRIDALEDMTSLVLRAMPVNASAHAVIEGLLTLDGRKATGPLTVETPDAFYLVQPVAPNRAIVRGLAKNAAAPDARIADLREHNERLTALRERIEALAPSEPEEDVEIPLSLPVMTVSGATTTLGREAGLRVCVARKWITAPSVAAFRLESINHPLPDFEAGAHIDVHLPNGLIRQYSLTNGPHETSAYVIGVKLEPRSGGGSSALHESVREGDVLAISEPRNNFNLVKNAQHTTLIAGGIGITPLLAMAKTLHPAGKPFALHYFVRSMEYTAFREDLMPFGTRVRLHERLDGDGTRERLGELLATRPNGGHVYICGPWPMLEVARAAAEQAGWPEDAVHFECFSNTLSIDDSSAFEIVLARSALTLQVPAGKTIVQVLRDNGISIPTSCEQGACGTCLTTVLDGRPDHQDVYLSKAEQASGACILPCISRAKSSRLTLDI